MNTNYGQSPACMGTLKFMEAIQVNGKSTGIVKNLEIDAKEIRQIRAMFDMDRCTQITKCNDDSYVVGHAFEKVFPVANKLRSDNKVEYFA